MINNEEIIEKLAKKHGLPEEQIKLVINSFWDGFRYYLTHPLESKDGIWIHNLFSFYIDKRKVQNFIERLKLTTFQNKPSTDKHKIEFYQELLDNKNKYERQKKKPIFNKRLSEESQDHTEQSPTS